ncbi:MAG: hypothetical protein AAF311_11765 [Pseudomonadota bacterium]
MANSAQQTSDTRRDMAELQIELKDVDRQLGRLNWEMAGELITLAEQTDDPAVLIEAVEALRSATRYYTFEDAPRDHARIQQAIADTLLSFGQRTGDGEALGSARDAYRGAITLASLLSDEALRDELRVNYQATLTLLGERPKAAPLFRVA